MFYVLRNGQYKKSKRLTGKQNLDFMFCNTFKQILRNIKELNRVLFLRQLHII